MNEALLTRASTARGRLLAAYPTTTPAYLAYCHATGHSPELAVPNTFKRWEHDIQMDFCAAQGVTLTQFRMMAMAKNAPYNDFLWASAQEDFDAKNP